jgi:hypothetical protein
MHDHLSYRDYVGNQLFMVGADLHYEILQLDVFDYDHKVLNPLWCCVGWYT